MKNLSPIELISEFLSAAHSRKSIRRDLTNFCKKFNKNFAGYAAYQAYHEDDRYPHIWETDDYKKDLDDLIIYELSGLQQLKYGGSNFHKASSYTSEFCFFLFISCPEGKRQNFIDDMKKNKISLREKSTKEIFNEKLIRNRDCSIPVIRKRTYNNWDAYQYKIIASKLGVAIAESLKFERERQSNFLNSATQPGKIDFQRLKEFFKYKVAASAL